MTLTIVSNTEANGAILQVVSAQDATAVALVASELRFQKEMEKAALVQRKFQQEATETIVALGQENAQLKVALVASEGTKKEIESLNRAKEKAVQEENEKLKEENRKLKENAAILMKQLEDVSKKNVALAYIYSRLKFSRKFPTPEAFAEHLKQMPGGNWAFKTC